MKPKFLLSLVLGILVSIAGFHLAFRNVPFESLMVYAVGVDYRWIASAVVVLILIFYLRALRWQMLLRPLGRISLPMAYHSLIISFMLNAILPGRMGEMARPLILKKKEGVAFSAALATLAAERLLDLATLLMLLFMALPSISLSSAQPVVFGSHELNADVLMRLTRTSAIALVVLALALALIIYEGTRKHMSTLVRRLAEGVRRVLPASQSSRINLMEDQICALLERFAVGLQYLKTPGNVLTVTLLSLLTWLLIGLSFYLVARGSPGIELGFADTLVMLVIICIFIALPSVPGYWGLWEAAGVFALYCFGIPKEQALGYTLFNHALQILPLIPAGFISCMLLGFNWSDIKPRRFTGDMPDGGA
ncbi:MAG: lysylphosphatidylglycerol synthase transmembrane domain-containing protein [Desulfobacterales bacterium]|nr:lysylphosphatidylglycerol synthase transmembrane domain-containing protein [Desulfobacterales bacterium]